eukprot:CAMPEP_0168188276 /NCGR_PEP_ID=MMETSP0139_2-20121125/15543_1 /TAXON_ID=44445 /ORGANISM="Pseudo-nitzschia australis, Strain 10249 10 AB" /LENGTH=158 /DNA_ID=CAMNT_0008110667 /DNA_START=2236 /DNA_END=2712 /DNA_ORIENTATION=+
MANKTKRTTRGTTAKQVWTKPPTTPTRTRTRRQTSLLFVSPAKKAPAVPMDLVSDDEELTQDTFASTTTPTLEMLALKQPPDPKAQPSDTAAAAASASPDADAAVIPDAASDDESSAALDDDSSAASDNESSASSVSTERPSDTVADTLKDPPALKPT